MPNLVWHNLRFWWAAVGLAFAIWELLSTVRDANQPGWFWCFAALVPVVVGVTLEWARLWRRVNDEKVQLRGIGRRVQLELRTMERDLDRVELAGRYDGFTPLPSATWTAEATRFEQCPELFGPVSEAYLKADAFNKDISTRTALAGGTSIGVIAQDGIPALRAAITEAQHALSAL